MIPAVSGKRRASGAPSTLLLHFDTPSIVDSSGNNIGVTAVGSAVTSSTVAKFGPSSLFQPGNGSYLVANDPLLHIGNQDCTIDAWVYATALSGQQFLLDTRTAPGQYNGLAIYNNAGSWFWFDGAASYGGSTAMIGNTWNHIELDIASGVAYLFFNGALVSTTPGVTGSFASQSWVIGAAQYTPPGVNVGVGYTDEFHFLAGTALHTAPFTPPTSPYP